MFLICGLHNSGTTILAKILNLHPDLKVLHVPGNKNFELSPPHNIWRNAVKSAGGTKDYSSHASYAALILHGLEYYEETLRKSCNLNILKSEFEKHFDDFTGVKENHLVNYPNVVNELFPNAIKILIVRNIVNVAISKSPKNQVEKAQVSCLRAMRVLDNWVKLPNTLIIRYENLVMKPTTYMKKIITFINPKLDTTNISSPEEIKIDTNNKWNKYNKSNKSKIENICLSTQQKLDKILPLE